MRINKEVEIKIYHNNKSVKVLHAPRGKKLLDLLRDNDIRISCPCSGSGTCGKCKVQFLDDGVRITTADLKHIPKEDLERGYRLACMSILTEDARIAIQDYNEDNIVCPESTSSENEVIKVANPDIVVSPDIRAYSEGLDNISKTDFFYGIGIDLGTTTIAVSLIKLPDSEIESRGVNTNVSKLNPNRCRELHQFEPLDTFFARDKGLKNGNSSISAPGSGFTEDSWSHNIVHVVTGTNHQRSYGTDVISRIKASKEKGKRLKELVVRDIEDLIQKLLTQTGCSYSRIKRIAIAGNTTMLHLLRGYNCESLGVYPYTPVNLDIEDLKAGDIFPELEDNISNIPVTILPGFSAFVGADILSGLYATRPWKMDHEYIFLDLGTNGEMAAGFGDKIYVTSTAAGPVFEGNGIRYGIPGIPGAIKGAEFAGGKLKVTTIEDAPPIGICGTGVLEIISALVREGLVDETGLLSEEYFDNGYPVSKDEDGTGIVITQNDIRQVQMAKAAVNVGLDLLYEKIRSLDDQFPSSKERLARNKDKAGKPYVIISGGFGSGISFDRIKELKMFPASITDNGDNIYIAGNTSLLGTARYLCIASLYGTKIAREELCMIQRMAKEIELSQDDSFSDRYYEAMNF